MEIPEKTVFIGGFILLMVFVCFPVTAAIDARAAPYYKNGVQLASLGLYNESLAAYDEAIAIDPGYARTWTNRGFVLANLGKYADALASYDKAIAIDPNDAVAYSNRGLALAKLDRNAESFASYEKAIAINPDYANAWYNRGIALHALGRDTEAVASFDRALSINPKDDDAKASRDMILGNQSQPQSSSAAMAQSSTVSQPTGQQAKSAPLLYAPLGAVALVAGVALWTRRRS